MTTDKPVYSKEKLKMVENILSSAAKKAIKAGLILGQGQWGIELTRQSDKTYPPLPTWITTNGKCCINGAVLLFEQLKPAVTVYADSDTIAASTMCAHLDVSYDFFAGFVRGWDWIDYGDKTQLQSKHEQYIQGFNLGLKLGKKFFHKGDENE